MARASYVWIVQRWDTVLAAFTVKHELLTWLKEHDEKWPNDIFIVRFRSSDQSTDYYSKEMLSE